MPEPPAPSPRIIRLLNGGWKLSPGSAAGPPDRWGFTVPVPGLVDLASPPYNWSASEYHWYYCAFSLSDEERLYPSATLRIEQAMFGTKVWMNGILLGGDIACYTSQEYETTAALRAGENELLIRVGRRDTLPPESAVGKDQERSVFIPGIWGDVSLLLAGVPRVSVVQVIPRIATSTAEVRVTLANRSDFGIRVQVVSRIEQHRPGTSSARGGPRRGDAAKVVSPVQLKIRTAVVGSATTVRFTHRLRGMRLWSPEDPFLYDHVVQLRTAELFRRPSARRSTGDRASISAGASVSGASERVLDEVRTRFGMREFRASREGFFLNGKRVFLRGGNIAFHRFLSDGDRGTLPWDLDWIRKILIEIPKRHNFNFFRNHLGQMYSRWYDIADEGGMLLQNEWQFWMVSGSKQQITKEFTRWLQDNWNHPSIVIWDPLNESCDETVQRKIVPMMKRLDPTRPWESVDFLEEHPYIYSLGPVLTDRRFGFSRSLKEIEHSRRPTMLNEFLWWWLDKEGKPTSLTQEVVERWLGRKVTRAELLEHQAFLGRELVELFRRMEVDAIQPFVYLTCNDGPTSHWFMGDIGELRPKPVMDAMREAFAPFGVSIEMWDRHFFPDERRGVRVFLFNDRPARASGTLRVGVQRLNGSWVSKEVTKESAKPSATKIVRRVLKLPREPGEYRICAELVERGRIVARSVKPASVIRARRTGLQSRQTAQLVGSAVPKGGPTYVLEIGRGGTQPLLLVTGAALREKRYASIRSTLTEKVRAGATLVLLEPEYGDVRRVGDPTYEVLDGLKFSIKQREDADKGGYDSHVIMEDPTHPIWKGIKPEHLRFFNGGFGGEIVSQHDVVPLVPHTVLARCGLGLRVIAAAEINVDKGKVVLFRLQLRGRLTRGRRSSSLYDRRPDPVAQILMRNLLEYGCQCAAR